jgi:ATP-binding protein involved in chromosome partitioning
LRGNEITEIILELLTITNWGYLDYLIIDTPPTLTDTFLDLMRFIPSVKLILITDNSILSLNSALKFLNFLKENNLNLFLLVINKIHPIYLNSFNKYLKNLISNVDKYIYLDYIENIQNYYGKIEFKIEKIYKDLSNIFKE